MSAPLELDRVLPPYGSSLTVTPSGWKPMGLGGPYSTPAARRPMSTTTRSECRLMTVPPRHRGTAKGKVLLEELRLHERIDARLDLGDHRIGSRLTQRRYAGCRDDPYRVARAKHCISYLAQAGQPEHRSP